METDFHGWYQDLQVKRTMESLKKNNFSAQFVPDAAKALQEVFAMIPEGASVGVGGSLTLSQIGFFDEAGKRSVKLLNPGTQGVSQEEGVHMRREIFLADFFLSSSNAITEDGKLYNIDATGNRVGAMMFGPKNVILVCGVNKIVKNIAEAQAKVQEWVAPMNARRLGMKTPCVETGQCADCSSPQRICSIYTVIAKKPLRTNMTVLIVGQPLGF